MHAGVRGVFAGAGPGVCPHVRPCGLGPGCQPARGRVSQDPDARLWQPGQLRRQLACHPHDHRHHRHPKRHRQRLSSHGARTGDPHRRSGLCPGSVAPARHGLRDYPARAGNSAGRHHLPREPALPSTADLDGPPQWRGAGGPHRRARRQGVCARRARGGQVRHRQYRARAHGDEDLRQRRAQPAGVSAVDVCGRHLYPVDRRAHDYRRRAGRGLTHGLYELRATDHELAHDDLQRVFAAHARARQRGAHFASD